MSGEPEIDWCGVVIYPHREVESEYTQNYRELLNSARVNRIYLNETENESSWGISTIKLITTEANQIKEKAQPLIEKVRQQIREDKIRREILELIERILVYKLPEASREEIEAMFSLDDLKQTRFYREVRQEVRQEVKQEVRQEVGQETKLECLPRLLQLGLSLEDIAQSLDLSLDIVRQEARKYQQQ